jgi:hypothetical protein
MLGFLWGFLFLSYFIVTPALFVPCGGRKKSPVHSIRDVIFPILKDCPAWHNCCACVILVFSVRHLSGWVVPVFLTWIRLNHPNDMWPAFWICLLTSYLWYAGFITSDPLLKFHFIKFRQLFFRLGHMHLFTWGPYAAVHGMAFTCHIEGSMITTIWTHLRMFQNSKFYKFMINVEFCLSWW